MTRSVAVTDQPRKRKATEAPTTVLKPKLSRKVTSTINLPTPSESDDFYLPSNEWNFKITTWNVAGLRAVVKKGGMDFIKKEDPDIICLQVSVTPKPITHNGCFYYKPINVGN